VLVGGALALAVAGRGQSTGQRPTGRDPGEGGLERYAVLALECSYGPMGGLLGDHVYVPSEGRFHRDRPAQKLFGDARSPRAYLGG
jgi:hypothetical protein